MTPTSTTTELKDEAGRRFRKKPVEVEAWQNCLDGGMTPDWVLNAVTRTDMGAYYIQTLEGEMRADHGDWIIKGVKGEVYPCKPDIFDLTYECSPAPAGAGEGEIEAVAAAIRQQRNGAITPPSEGTDYDRRLAVAAIAALRRAQPASAQLSEAELVAIFEDIDDRSYEPLGSNRIRRQYARAIIDRLTNDGRKG